jgi:hypothetical protein
VSFLRLVALCGFVLIISTGCGTTNLTRTIFDTFPIFGADLDELPLKPGLKYLRVSVHGRTALMVLGYSDVTPEGLVETWYSNAGETISLRNGRILATAGLSVDWRSVRADALPDWSELLQLPHYDYQRVRDEMPGYRFDIRETVRISPQKVVWNSQLVAIRADQLQWFEERVVGDRDGALLARYALRTRDGKAELVYSEQCLSEDLCIAFQSWPVS